MRYQVEILTTKPDLQPEMRRIGNLSFTKAWRITRRAARRGVKRFGGELSFGNWGACGGQFPRECTVAVIKLAR